MVGKNILKAVLLFLVGCLVLAVVVYICHLVIGFLALPAAIAQIAVLVVGLGGLIVLFVLAYNVYIGAGGP